MNICLFQSIVGMLADSLIFVFSLLALLRVGIFHLFQRTGVDRRGNAHLRAALLDPHDFAQALYPQRSVGFGVFQDDGELNRLFGGK